MKQARSAGPGSEKRRGERSGTETVGFFKSPGEQKRGQSHKAEAVGSAALAGVVGEEGNSTAARGALPEHRGRETRGHLAWDCNVFRWFVLNSLFVTSRGCPWNVTNWESCLSFLFQRVFLVIVDPEKSI